MRLLVISDLHVEFESNQERDWISGEKRPDDDAFDAVILPGDIHNGVRSVQWAKQTFPRKPVFMVAGNHEYYGECFTELPRQMRYAAAGSNVRFLENESVAWSGIRFLGTTLWTDFDVFLNQAEFMRVAPARMRDYQWIRYDHRRAISPEDVLTAHRNARAWLATALAQPWDGKTVVITHHLPSESCIPPEWINFRDTPAYASNLNSLIGSDIAPDLWVFGHTHANQDRILGDTRFVCNPRGYTNMTPGRLNPGFDPGFIIDI